MASATIWIAAVGEAFGLAASIVGVLVERALDAVVAVGEACILVGV